MTLQHVRKQPAVIVDCDGTLVNVHSVRHLVVPEQGGKKNFPEFHRQAEHCPPNEMVLDYVRTVVALGALPLVTTARMEQWRASTERWLERHLRPLSFYYLLTMRADGDYRPDTEVKTDMHARLSADYDIVGAIDDNPKVVALWRSLGIPTVEVPGWWTGPDVPVAGEGVAR